MGRSAAVIVASLVIAIAAFVLWSIVFMGVTTLPLLLIYASIGIIYVTPTINALALGNEKLRLIATINLIFGWTGVWWIIALGMAHATDDGGEFDEEQIP